MRVMAIDYVGQGPKQTVERPKCLVRGFVSPVVEKWGEPLYEVYIVHDLVYMVFNSAMNLFALLPPYLFSV